MGVHRLRGCTPTSLTRHLACTGPCCSRLPRPHANSRHNSLLHVGRRTEYSRSSPSKTRSDGSPSRRSPGSRTPLADQSLDRIPALERKPRPSPGHVPCPARRRQEASEGLQPPIAASYSAALFPRTAPAAARIARAADNCGNADPHPPATVPLSIETEANHGVARPASEERAQSAVARLMAAACGMSGYPNATARSPRAPRDDRHGHDPVRRSSRTPTPTAATERAGMKPTGSRGASRIVRSIATIAHDTSRRPSFELPRQTIDLIPRSSLQADALIVGLSTYTPPTALAPGIVAR